LNKKVLIIEKRNHIGGNAFDYFNEDYVLVHKYVLRILRTNNKEGRVIYQSLLSGFIINTNY